MPSSTHGRSILLSLKPRRDFSKAAQIITSSAPASPFTGTSANQACRKRHQHMWMIPAGMAVKKRSQNSCSLTYILTHLGFPAVTRFLGPMMTETRFTIGCADWQRVRKCSLQGTGKDPVQYIDVRDLAIWILDSTETKRTGIYNTCGAGQPIIFKDFLEGARKAIGSSAKLTWVDADFLRSEQEVRSFSDMPLWAPLDEDEGFIKSAVPKPLKRGELPSIR